VGGAPGRGGGAGLTDEESTGMAVSLSPVAVKRVKELMDRQNLQHAFLRMGVKGGGCSGLSYNLEFDTELGKFDKQFEIDGVKVVVDAKSYLYLNGSTLDYVTQGLTGGFTFVNPNAKSSCGCGTSFTA
jgi:iron-sulfur cluster assembly protein